MRDLTSLLNVQTTPAIQAEMDWLKEILDTHIKISNGEACAYSSIEEIPLPLADENSFFGQIIINHNFGFKERLVLALALAPHLLPALLDTFKGSNRSIHGGQYTKNHNGFIPTGETALFLLAGRNIEKRIEAQQLFESDHAFLKDGILELSPVESGEPRMSGILLLTENFMEMIVHGKKMPPKFSKDFPAKQITTEMNWEDLVLSPHTHGQLNEIKLWMKHYREIRTNLGLGKKLRPGYKVLFHGPPGTGKTLAARLLGKETKREVFRIDLSMMVSKYIGETEKNLAKVFNKAERSEWILFFDEADALFGSRTSVGSSHDKYANQEVSFLLQRIEDYEGLVILASNFKNNIDSAFLRRFDSMVHFPSPKAEERLQLWQKAFPPAIWLADDINLQQVAQAYEITGAHIANIVAHSMLYAVDSGLNLVDMKMLKQSIARELAKEGRTI